MKAINIEWDIDYDDNGYLPTEIEIPKTGHCKMVQYRMTDVDEIISQYLSEVTGFCHGGFVLVNKCENGNDTV